MKRLIPRDAQRDVLSAQGASTSSFNAHAFFLARSRNSSAFWKQESQEGCFEARLLMRSISLRIPWAFSFDDTCACRSRCAR